VSRRTALVTLLSAAALFGCSPDVPEPETPPAQLYVSRCGGCHRVYAPGSMTAAMWEMQVERMRGELVRRGVPPLNKEERETVLAYLRRHSSGTHTNP
jgi:hypothetical protein